MCFRIKSPMPGFRAYELFKLRFPKHCLTERALHVTERPLQLPPSRAYPMQVEEQMGSEPFSVRHLCDDVSMSPQTPLRGELRSIFRAVLGATSRRRHWGAFMGVDVGQVASTSLAPPSQGAVPLRLFSLACLFCSRHYPQLVIRAFVCLPVRMRAPRGEPGPQESAACLLGDGQPAVGGPEDGDRSGHGGPPPWLLFPAGISLRVRVSVRVKDGRTRRDPLTSQTHTGQRFVFCPCCWAIDKVEAGTQGARCSRLVSATTVLGRGDVAVGTWPGTSGLEWCTHLQL